MLGDSGTLFNLSVSDLKGFVDELNADEGRRLRREFSKVDKRLQNIVDLSKEQIEESAIDREVWEELTEELHKERENIIEQEKKRRATAQIEPDKTLLEKVDSITGDYIDLSELTSKGIFKLTGTIISAIFSPSVLALKDMNNTISEIGINSSSLYEDFQAINDTSQELVRKNERLSGSSVGHLNTLVDIREQYGAMEHASIETLDTIESFPFAIGLAVEEGREFLGVLRGITAQGANFNTKIIRSIKSMSDANDIPMKYVMDDISENADFFAQRSGVGMKNIAESVVYAEKLGIEMSTINSMLSGLEDVESIIESQMKMSLFTGEQINLLDSATANFYGETREATESILEQMEKIDKSTFDMPFVRKQMAEQLNVSATELNKIYGTVQDIGAEEASINLGFNDEYEKFRDNMNSLGLSKLKKTLQRDLFNPMNNAMQQNTWQLNKLTDGMSFLISKISSSILAPVFEAMPTLLPSMTAIIGGLSAIGANNMIEMRKMGILETIAINTGISAGKEGIRGGSSGVLANNKGKIGKGLAGLTAVMSGMNLISESRKDRDDRSGLNMLLSGAMTGASIGSLIPGLGTATGLIGGGVIGGLGGLGLHSGLAEGGVVTEPIMSPLGEGGKKEAVIPLENQSATENMKMSLSDSTIDKLAHKLSNGSNKVVIEYKANGKTYSDKEKFFKEITQ